MVEKAKKMKGIILAGGKGTRLEPCTYVTNKHLLPVYNKPMIYYPLQTLIQVGIKEILIISSPEYMGHFIRLLGSGEKFGIKLTYKIQDEVGGIAHALGLAEKFATGENMAVILGDNIFEDNPKEQISTFKDGALIFLKEVPNPKEFGVAITEGDNILEIQEKPKNPKTNKIVTGLYVYDNKVFDIIKILKPSVRGELEITDVNNEYIKKGKMKGYILTGFWNDAGTFDSLLAVSNYMKEKNQKME